MQIIDLLTSEYKEKIVLGLGFFDCLHLGHRTILSKVKEYSEEKSCKSALFTFTNDISSALGRGNGVVYSFEERIKLFEANGCEVCIKADFDHSFRTLTSSQFLALLDKLQLAAVVCGQDYTFGCDRANKQLLQTYCDNRGIIFCAVPELQFNGIKVSTSEIKSLIAQGDVLHANKLLGAPYSITGMVISGRGVGRNLGFPTANLQVNADKLLPDGVFCGSTIINGKLYTTITNIGCLPTFNLPQKTVETHIIGFSGDLYGKTLTLQLDCFMRKIIKFNDAQELVEQLKKDIQYANQIRSQR